MTAVPVPLREGSPDFSWLNASNEDVNADSSRAWGTSSIAIDRVQ
jgi:hypothetical protein